MRRDEIARIAREMGMTRAFCPTHGCWLQWGQKAVPAVAVQHSTRASHSPVATKQEQGDARGLGDPAVPIALHQGGEAVG